MKKLSAIVVLSTLLSLTAIAQTPRPRSSPVTPTKNPPGPVASSGAVAEGKFANLNTALFRTGINELKVKLDALNSELDPKQKEIRALEEELKNLKNRIQNQSNTVSPQVRSQWIEEAAEKEKQYKRKGEDYEQFAQKRLAEVTQPVFDKILKFLSSYCEQRGIAMVIDGGVAYQGGALIWATPTTDITEDFMKDYNKANPVVGGSPSPGAGTVKP
jgi:outer membrane protein